jgi:hypothetical protein
LVCWYNVTQGTMDGLQNVIPLANQNRKLGSLWWDSFWIVMFIRTVKYKFCYSF